MIDEILKVARCFLGQTLTDGQEQVLQTLCEGAADQWEARLLDGLTPEDCRKPFVTACAWTALSRLIPALEAGTSAPTSFSAGDLSVSVGTADEDGALRAVRLGQQAEAILADYTRDGGLVFLGVAG
ncbi:MAG: hypothetical protein IKU62_08200 [Ruminiclostridium sp.]|nr:hypothetical protein [Ruminiclostridium sp.]